MATGSADGVVGTAAPSAPRVRIQSFEEILQQVRAGALPTCMPAVPGSAVPSGLRLPARPLSEWPGSRKGPPTWGQRGEVCPTASADVIGEAREHAKRQEENGIDAARKSGVIPKGPPALPMGAMVIEQKFVDFIVGPGGQSLAALNYAAGVNVHLDQSRKFSGYTVAHIYGPEDCARRAKVALEFKISQWLPRGVTYAMAAPIGAVTPLGEAPLPRLHGHREAQGPGHASPTNLVTASTSACPYEGPSHLSPTLSVADPHPRGGGVAAGASKGLPGAAEVADAVPLSREALDDALAQSLAKWPSLARSAAMASAARASAGVDTTTTVTGGVL